MSLITIIILVVIALLTITIFGLAWLAYNSCMKLYKLELDQGKHDEEIYQEYCVKHKAVWGLIGNVISYIALIALSCIFFIGLFYKISGNNITINNKTILVIRSNSMSDWYDDDTEGKSDYNADLQFKIGDICIFEELDETELVEGEVYGYKRKNIIITHRLIKIQDELYEFKGDNNPVSDGFVQKSNIIYHYTGQKISGVGSFILYAQSYFGIWSLTGMIIITIISEIVYHKISKMNKERSKYLKEKDQTNEEVLYEDK